MIAKGYKDLVMAGFATQITDYFNGIRAHEIHKNKQVDQRKIYIQNYKGHATQALYWIKNKEEDYVFSFESCCKILEIDPAKMRKRILAIKSPKHVYEILQKRDAMEHFGIVAAKREKEKRAKILSLEDL